MKRGDAHAATMARSRLALSGTDGVAPTVFVPTLLRARIGLRAKDASGARATYVIADASDPRVLWVGTRLARSTWGALGLWHLFVWFKVRKVVAPLVPGGVRLRVRPW